jgi:hypothetical protein
MISQTHGRDIPLLTVRVPMFQGKTASCFVPEGNTFSTNFTYDAPCFILAFRRCRRAFYTLDVSLGRVISRRGRLALARIPDTLLSARGDGSKDHTHRGVDSDGDANEMATLQVAFLVRSAGMARRARTDGCPRPYPQIWMLGATTGSSDTGRKKREKSGR